MRAERIVAAGRSGEVLAQLREAGGERVRPVILTGDVQADSKALKDAAGGRGAQLAFDQAARMRGLDCTIVRMASG